MLKWRVSDSWCLWHIQQRCMCVCVYYHTAAIWKVHINRFASWNIRPFPKDNRYISANKHWTTKALHFMNIKSDSLNTTSVVWGGSSLDSYHLLWFICRCVCLFDVLVWEVLHLLEGEEMPWKQEADLPDSQNNNHRRKIYVAMVHC